MLPDAWYARFPTYILPGMGAKGLNSPSLAPARVPSRTHQSTSTSSVCPSGFSFLMVASIDLNRNSATTAKSLTNELFDLQWAIHKQSKCGAGPLALKSTPTIL